MNNLHLIDPDINFVYQDFTLKPIINVVKEKENYTFIFPMYSEYKFCWYESYLNYDNQFQPDNLFKEFGEILSQKNNKFYLIVGSEYNEVFSHFINHPIPNFEVIFWSTYLFSHIHNNFKIRYPNREWRINKEFNHLFICYNNKSRYHRCKMMDELCKKDLLKDNLYSWIESRNLGFGHGTEKLGGEYHFECFDDVPKKIDEYDFNVNREFTDNLFELNCFINVVTESDVDALFITEKTYRQLMIGQPFLSLCAKGTHSKLKEYGFELYEEIFDYSFDSESDYKDRIKGIVNNLDSIKNQDYYQLYDKIKDKVEHNVQLCYKIINESYLTPKFITDLVKYKFGQLETINLNNCNQLFISLKHESIVQ